MKYFLLIYTVVDDYTERRSAYRSEHLALATESAKRGELLLGGALTNPVDKAVLVFQADSPDVAEHFATTDPYVLNGLVTSWEVREWTVVVGAAFVQ